MKMPMRVRHIAILLAAALVLGACTSASQHRAQVRDDATDRVTVGKVQREIRVGMSGAEVVEVLGSPNMVSTDENRREVWVYDKVATEHAYSTSSGGITALILGGGSSLLGGGGLGGSSGSGASSTSQRTLTIVIKFDGAGRVRDFAYHTTQF